LSKIDYTQLTEQFKKRWNLLADKNKTLREEVQHLLTQMVEIEDKAERGRLKTSVETFLDRIRTNRNQQVGLQRNYSFLCGKHFSEIWLPDRDIAVSFDPSRHDFSIE